MAAIFVDVDLGAGNARGELRRVARLAQRVVGAGDDQRGHGYVLVGRVVRGAESRSRRAGRRRLQARRRLAFPGALHQREFLAPGDMGVVVAPSGVVQHRLDQRPHRVLAAVIGEQDLAFVGLGREPAAAAQHDRAQRQEAGLGRGDPHEIAAAHRVADEVGLPDPHDLDETLHVAVDAASRVAEVEHLVGAPEAEPVRRDDAELGRQRGDGELPADLGRAAVLAGMEEDHGRPLARLQVMGADAVDVDVPAGDFRHRTYRTNAKPRSPSEVASTSGSELRRWAMRSGS